MTQQKRSSSLEFKKSAKKREEQKNEESRIEKDRESVQQQQNLETENRSETAVNNLVSSDHFDHILHQLIISFSR